MFLINFIYIAHRVLARSRVKSSMKSRWRRSATAMSHVPVSGHPPTHPNAGPPPLPLPPVLLTIHKFLPLSVSASKWPCTVFSSGSELPLSPPSQGLACPLPISLLPSASSATSPKTPSMAALGPRPLTSASPSTSSARSIEGASPSPSSPPTITPQPSTSTWLALTSASWATLLPWSSMATTQPYPSLSTRCSSTAGRWPVVLRARSSSGTCLSGLTNPASIR